MTDTPRTLLSLAGANPRPPALSEATVLLIDMQREYLNGLLPLPDAESAVAEAARLLTAARAAGAGIVHVVHRGRSGGAFDPAGTGFAPAEPLIPAPGEILVEKTLPNAFAGTDLAARLAALGDRPLIVAGFMTHMCVSSTVRAALDLGQMPTVLASATATRALPDPLGGVLSADQVQRAALAALADRFALVVPDLAGLRAEPPIKTA